MTHRCIWQEFNLHFTKFMNQGSEEGFLAFVRYFTILSTILPKLPISEYIQDRAFVLSFTLMLDCHFDVIRGTVVKIIGTIAQSYFYQQSTEFILDAVVEISSISMRNQRDFCILLYCPRQLFPFVRTGPSVGFFNDERRMSVALTRAKSKVFILGNANQLTKHVLWNNLIGDAKERNLFFKFDFQSLAKNIKVIPAVSFAEQDQSSQISEQVKNLSFKNRKR